MSEQKLASPLATGYNLPMNKVTSTKELMSALESLPEFSRKVYDALMAGLYAEPGFSDVTATDLAKKLGCPAKAINASLGHLMEVGLVETEEWETYGNPKQIFIHSFEHDDEISRTEAKEVSK